MLRQVELTDAMRSQHACRYFLPDDVPDRVLYAAVEAARFAPNGGNRNAVRFLIVKDADKRRRLGEWYLPLWRAVSEGAPDSDYPQRLGFSNLEKAKRDGDHFAEHFGTHPAIVVVCIDPREVHATDAELDRLSIVGGASVYPMAQNLCLALRDQGVASSLTTLLVAREPDVKAMLGIPEHLITACHLAIGYPAKPFPTRLRRLPVDELAFVDTFASPLTG